MDLASILLNSGLDTWLLMVISIALLGVGFVCLIKGADWFVDGAAGIAEKLRVPTLIIGLTVVSFGTSAPELATSIISAAQGGNGADIAIGNVIGSNITNILLILGVAAVICPLVVQKSALLFDFPVLLGSSVLVLLLGGFDGKLGRIDGAIMFVISMAYMAFLVVYGVRESKKEGTMSALNNHEVGSLDKEKGFAGQNKNSWYKRMCQHTWFLILVTIVGLALVVAGALFGVIPGAKVVATKIGLSEKIIGLTVVAIGTSLPELVTCVVAAKKGETDIAVGDILGSNIFNIIRTLGICSIIIPLNFAASFWVDGLIALGAAVMLAVFGYMKGHKVRRWAGIVMLVCFALYYVYLFAFSDKVVALLGA